MATGTRVPAGNRDLGTRVQNLNTSQPYSVAEKAALSLA